MPSETLQNIKFHLNNNKKILSLLLKEIFINFVRIFKSQYLKTNK
jgi:hypothetical protein